MKGVRERLVVELDPVASELLRRHLNGRSFMRRYGDDPRAVASAALYCLLGRDSGAVDLLNQAVKRNKAFYGKPVVQQHPPVAVEIDVEAAAMLARYCKETGIDARDIASGAVYQVTALLLNMGNWPLDECIQSAKLRRHSRAMRDSVLHSRSKRKGKEAT